MSSLHQSHNMYCIYSRTVINIKKNMYYNNSEHSTHFQGGDDNPKK